MNSRGERMRRPMTIIVTANKGGSGKTPIAINLVIWALSRQPSWRVLAIDINHTNQDLFQALQHVVGSGTGRFETAFTLPKTGTVYYLPVSDHLHLVRPRSFQPLSVPQIIEMITSSCGEFARQREQSVFTPDMIVLDGNYCFPSFRPEDRPPAGWPPFTFMNIWSITSPHELRVPTDYRNAITEFKTYYDQQPWDCTNFIHIFTLLEKERKLSSEVGRLVRMQRAVYSVQGSDDLADVYKSLATNNTSKSTGFSFDQIQREIFSPLLAEIDSLSTEDTTSYSEDTINARWIERINIFLTQYKTFPLNVFPFPHYYPFLRKAVVDMILRERIEISEIQRMFGDYYTWMGMFMERYVREMERATT